jgi:hypothetical protein
MPRMRQLITLIAIAGILTVNARAQSASRPTVQIHFSAHQTCIVADSDVSCDQVGNKLLALRIPLDADIHLNADTNSKASMLLPMLKSARESLERAGYKVKRALVTSGAP